MFNVTRRVSFAVVIALTVGWGIFFLLFLTSSNILLESQQASSEKIIPLPPGVRLNVQVDKRIYRGGDAVLLAVRNDSRLPIWIQTSNACPTAWWSIEQLGADGETWVSLAVSKQDCPRTGITQFTGHSLKTDAWLALVPGPQVGDVMVNAPTGTYRISVPYVKGKNITADSWKKEMIAYTTSPTFVIQ